MNENLLTYQKVTKLPKNLQTYSKDVRWPIQKLYQSYEQFILAEWAYEVVAIQQVKINDQQVGFPILAFFSDSDRKNSDETFWALAGVHGEEPAGVNAFARQTEYFIKMAQKNIPMVVMPLLNPAGYVRDWRYENTQRDFKIGQSVTACDVYLNKLRSPLESSVVPMSETAKKVTTWIIQNSKKHLPKLVFDHHEDELSQNLIDSQQIFSYLYYYGNPLFEFIGLELANLLAEAGLPTATGGQTRFGETISSDGMIKYGIDGSVDEMLGFDQKGAVIVIETTRLADDSVSLKKRMLAHEKIIQNYPVFWQQLQKKELAANHR